MKKTLPAFIFLLTICTVILVYSGIEFFQSEEFGGYVRQYTEERIVELYLQDIQEKSKSEVVQTDPEPMDDAKEKEERIIPADQVDLNYSDDNYEVIDGVKYTPDYAAGHLDCVLEIPKIKMRRGVYTGTASEIQHDLDIWMTTTAHTDYVLGETHYCIYGHNSPTQNLSFNDLKYVGVGDIFLLTTEDYVYLYDVTDFYPQWRELVKKEITDNFSLSTDKCYIITCGRDQYRYKDIIVEGTLREKYTIDEWFGTEIEIVPKGPEVIPANIVSVKEETSLRAFLQGEKLRLCLESKAGSPVRGAELCIADSDGLFLKNYQWNFVTDQNGIVDVPVSAFQTGVYYTVGVLNVGDIEQYEMPADLEFMIENRSEQKELAVETVTSDISEMDSYMIIWGVMLIVTAILAVICAAQTCKIIYNAIKKKTRERDR